jgi:hypothetical protein
MRLIFKRHGEPVVPAPFVLMIILSSFELVEN